MKCEQAESAMAELLAGELDSEARREVEAHLLECVACRADFETARAGSRVEWTDRPVPAALVKAALAGLGEPTVAVRFLRSATAAAAAFLVAALLLTLKTPEPLPRETVRVQRPRQPVLASVQAAVVGSLSAKDEEGRPVGELGLKSHAVTVEIADGIAKTTVEENFRNHTDRRLEGTFVFPLPPDASISRLALEVNGKIEEGTCLERERAREVFEGIVRKMQDPALLEWMPGGMFKCRVFPIEPHATKRVIVAYTQALPCFKGKLTYVYPLVSEKTQKHPPEELRIDVRARFGGRLTKVESPSHRLDIQRADGHQAAATLEARNARPESDFVLSMEVEEEVARVVSHKQDGDDGFFALFLTPRVAAVRKPRLTTFVLDVSASVSAPELEVAKKLMRAMMERRIEGDRFVLLAHNVEVEASGVVELREANAFLDRLSPVGACDVLKALQAAEGEIVYIGEGTPTFGETDHAKILEAMKGRKIRTVGVGSDANVTLLEKLGGHFRISTNDLVDRRVAEIAATFGSPAITGLRVEGGAAVYDVVGVRDIFAGERLVVTGRYRGPAAKLVVTAEGWRHEVEVAFPAKEEGNNYVRRLWAQRKAADLLAAGGKKEEVTALGVKHQIMTPYTSFLVLESEQMWKDHHLKREVQKQDEVLGKAREEERRKVGEEDSFRRKVDGLLGTGTQLYKAGKYAEATAAFEEAFQYKPSSDQVYKYIKRVGEELVTGMTNDADRRIKDTGRRLFELSKPGDPFREVPRPSSEAPLPPAPAEPPKPVPAVREQPETIRAIAGKVGDPFSAGVSSRTTFGKSTNLPVAKSDLPEIFTITTNVTAPGAPITDAPPKLIDLSEDGGLFWGNHSADSLADYDVQISTLAVALDPIASEYSWYRNVPALGELPVLAYLFEGAPAKLVTPAAGGGGPLTGATFTLDELYEAPDGKDFTRFSLVDVSKSRVGDTQNGQSRMRMSFGGTPQLDLQRSLDDTSARNWKMLAGRTGQFDRASIPQAGERLQKELSELEEKHVDLARDKEHLEKKIKHLNEIGIRTDIAPKKALDGKVTAVANEIGLVVISIGKDEEVLEGDEFIVFRGQEFVTKVVIDRTDRRWAAGKVVLKKVDPRVGDDVSNHIFVRSPSGEVVFEATEVLATNASMSEVWLRASNWARGQLFVITRDSKFVALVMVRESGRDGSLGGVWQGLAVGRVLPGDRAVPLADPGKYLAGLPEEVRMDLASRAAQRTVRAKMGIGQ